MSQFDPNDPNHYPPPQGNPNSWPPPSNQPPPAGDPSWSQNQPPPWPQDQSYGQGSQGWSSGQGYGQESAPPPPPSPDQGYGYGPGGYPPPPGQPYGYGNNAVPPPSSFAPQQQQYYMPQPQVFPGAVAIQCPYCHFYGPPRTIQKISTAGWVVFAILLFFCFPLCWIGLLMKEDQRACNNCGVVLG